MAVAFRAFPFLHSKAVTTARAATENRMSIATFHSDGESENRPKAAPWFCTWVRRNRPGITSTLSCRVILWATSHLVMRSSVTIRPAIMMWYFRIETNNLMQLSGAEQLNYPTFLPPKLLQNAQSHPGPPGSAHTQLDNAHSCLPVWSNSSNPPT